MMITVLMYINVAFATWQRLQHVDMLVHVSLQSYIWYITWTYPADGCIEALSVAGVATSTGLSGALIYVLAIVCCLPAWYCKA